MPRVYNGLYYGPLIFENSQIQQTQKNAAETLGGASATHISPHNSLDSKDPHMETKASAVSNIRPQDKHARNPNFWMPPDLRAAGNHARPTWCCKDAAAAAAVCAFPSDKHARGVMQGVSWCKYGARWVMSGLHGVQTSATMLPWNASRRERGSCALV